MQSPSIELESNNWNALLAAARDGDDAALGEICERLRAYLLLTAASDLGKELAPKFGASDIVQETMLEACRDFRSFKGSSEAEYRVWIRRLLERNLIDSARSYREAQSRSVGRELSLDQTIGQTEQPGRETQTASSIFSRRETDELLLRAVVRLPSKQRQIIEMRHRQGLSYPEIAAALNMTETAVRKTWSRTVQKLSRELSPVDEPNTTQSR